MGRRPTATPAQAVDRIRYWAVLLPLYLFAACCWSVDLLSVGGNISVAYLVPMSFLSGMLIVRVGRVGFLALLGRLKVEFCLLLLMVFLSLLSLSNSDEPFRAFRIIYPCLLPLLIFLQLCALRVISRDAVARIPRVFMYMGLVISGLPLLVSLVAAPVAGHIFSGYRLVGFFENANQHSIVLGSTLPILLAEISVSRRWLGKLGLGVLFLVLIYTLARTGSKTALLVSLSCGWVFYFLINVRSFSPMKRLAMSAGMVLIAVVVVTAGLEIAEMVDPVLAMKLRVIFSDGVGNYQSIKSREALWGNAIDQGTMHWLVGSGAGERVLGIAHAHNLVLDYFRGLGVFGAAAIVLLCITVLLRAGGGGVSALVRRAGADEKRTWACYAAAGIYVLCNQLSDCFGPSTIAALWLVYLPAVMTAPPRIRRSPARAWVALPARPTIPARTPQGLNPQI